MQSSVHVYYRRHFNIASIIAALHQPAQGNTAIDIIGRLLAQLLHLQVRWYKTDLTHTYCAALDCGRSIGLLIRIFMQYKCFIFATLISLTNNMSIWTRYNSTQLRSGTKITSVSTSRLLIYRYISRVYKLL